MGRGIDAVKAEITSVFKPTETQDGYDSILGEAVLYFAAEGRHFSVSVSKEFDGDYPNLQHNVGLNRLGQILRASKTGKVAVRRTGIVPI